MRKRKGVAQVLIGLLLVAALVLIPMACKAPEEAPPAAPPEEVAPPAAPPAEEAIVRPPGWVLTLDEIPEIENKTPIHIGLMSGAVPETILSFLDNFSEKTGVPVTHEFLEATLMYSKINTELVAGTGVYDIFNPEATATCEWSPYMRDFWELAEMYEPGGRKALEVDLEGYHPLIIRTASDPSGAFYGLPFYRYSQTFTYRQDILEDPIEKAAFKEKYGYDLAPATTWDQVRDMGEFFTRKKGELLKGEPLEWDFYGMALMAGRSDINDEFFTMVNGLGGEWTRSVYDENGKLTGFKITKEDKAILKESVEIYQSLMPYVTPGCESHTWDLVAEEMAGGRIAIAPTQWAELWTWCFGVEDTIPGAKLGSAPCVGGRPYYGCFYNAVSAESKNPEAAYWFSRYMGSYECQMEAAEAGWNSIRLDVLLDSQWDAPEWQTGNLMNRDPVEQVLAAWEKQSPYVEDVFNYCSFAAGKVYEQEIIILHDAAIGELTAQECVDSMTASRIELQTRFGKLPITEEK